MANPAQQRYTPGANAHNALNSIIQSLEGLDGRDRGFVLSRINALYFAKKAKKVQPAKPVKKPWKAEWESTPEYGQWRAFEAKLKADGFTKVTSSPEQTAELAAFRDRAFRKKNELQDKTGSKSQPAVPAGTASTVEPSVEQKPPTETKAAKPPRPSQGIKGDPPKFVPASGSGLLSSPTPSPTIEANAPIIEPPTPPHSLKGSGSESGKPLLPKGGKGK